MKKQHASTPKSADVNRLRAKLLDYKKTTRASWTVMAQTLGTSTRTLRAFTEGASIDPISRKVLEAGVRRLERMIKGVTT